MVKTVKIIKKALETFFSRLQALTNCKVSEKSNEPFLRKSIASGQTGVRTDIRTDTTPKISMISCSRDKKKLRPKYPNLGKIWAKMGHF